MIDSTLSLQHRFLVTLHQKNRTGSAIALLYRPYVTYLASSKYTTELLSSRRKLTETARILRLRITIHYLFVVVTFKTSIHRTI